MQLKWSKEVKNLKEGREISKNSCEVKNYFAQNKSMWDETYARFIKLVKI